jgi:hypothetical protein
MRPPPKPNSCPTWADGIFGKHRVWVNETICRRARTGIAEDCRDVSVAPTLPDEFIQQYACSHAYVQ